MSASIVPSTLATALVPAAPETTSRPIAAQVVALDQALRQVARLAGDIAQDERACPHGLRELARRAMREAQARATSMSVLAEHAQLN